MMSHLLVSLILITFQAYTINYLNFVDEKIEVNNLKIQA